MSEGRLGRPHAAWRVRIACRYSGKPTKDHPVLKRRKNIVSKCVHGIVFATAS